MSPPTDERELADQLRRVGRVVDEEDDDGMLDRVVAHVFGGASDPSVMIARFQATRCIGRGGMGAVYEAVDPDLQRRVAIKVLRKDVGSVGRRQRILEAEARALARLTDRHVVHVYEIGQHEGALFIVMELVEGTNLERWQPVDGRSRLAQVLELYVQAGRGLAAAHRVGLVHRDFKPANVLVRADGEVRVADFGLALADDDDLDTVNAVSGELPGEKSTRRRVGTREYMAPEQLELGTADARTDQFSFCVSLYEAACGVRPFDFARLLEIAGAPDVPSAPTRGPRRIPGWLASILERGLDPRPAHRWPSMDALVEALVHTPRRRRAAAIFGGAIAALIVGVIAWPGDREPSCDPTAELAHVWNDDVATRLQHSTVEAASFAAAAREQARTGIDDYALRWRESYEDACRARWIDGTRTAEHYGSSIACLDTARTDLSTAIELLSGADAETLARVSDVLARLPSPEACREGTVLVQASSDRDRSLQSATDRARLLLAAGRPREALALSNEVELDDVDAGNVSASAWVVRGTVLAELAEFASAEAALLHGSGLALASGDMRTAVVGLRELVVFYARAVPDAGRATVTQELLAGVVRRVELPPGERAAIEDAKGLVARLHDRPGDAAAHHREALAILELSGERDPLRISATRRRLGTALQLAGELADAQRIYDEVLADLTTSVGADNPEVATVEFALGSLALGQGRVDVARPHFERALQVYEAAFGPSSIRLAEPLTALAHCALLESDATTAARLAARAWALQQELPPHHPDRGSALAVLAGAHAELDEYELALAEHEQALRELDGRMTPDQQATFQQNVGWLMCQVGRCSEARPHFERVAIDAPADAGLRAYAESGLAAVEIAESRPRAAIERLERLRLTETFASDAKLAAEVETLLVRARSLVAP